MQITQKQLAQVIREELEALKEEALEGGKEELEKLRQVLKDARPERPREGWSTLPRYKKGPTDIEKKGGGEATLQDIRAKYPEGAILRNVPRPKELKKWTGPSPEEAGHVTPVAEWTSYEGDQQLFENWRRFVGE